MKKIKVILFTFFCSSLSAYSQQTLIFEDNFENNTEGWFVDKNQIVHGGVYELFPQPDYNKTWMEDKPPVQFKSSDNYMIEMKFSLIDHGSNEGFSILFGNYKDHHQAYATYYPDGKFEFFKRNSDNTITSVSGQIQIDLADTKNNITMKVERKGAILIAYINDKMIYSLLYNKVDIADFRDIGFKNSAQLHTQLDYIKVYKEINLTPSNFTELNNVYPEFKKIEYNNSILYNGDVLFAGCADGDCENGKGTYIRVIVDESDRWQDEFKVRYQIYKGAFDSLNKKFIGKYFKKTCWVKGKGEKIVPTAKNNSVANLGIEELFHDGEFWMYTKDYNRPEVYTMIPQGNFTSDEVAKYKYKFKKCSGVQYDSEALYAEIEYENGNVYKGLVDNDYKPIIGKLNYSNGEIYEGSFVNDTYEGVGRLTKQGKVIEGLYSAGNCVKEQKAFIPSVELLKKAAQNFGASQAIEIVLNPLLVQKETEIKLTGKLYNTNGECVDTIRNGAGIFYGRFGDYGKIYVGEFKNNVPNGYGLALYKRAKSGVYPENWNYYSGNFTNGVLSDGRFKHKVESIYGGYFDYETNIKDIEIHPDLNQAMQLFSLGKIKEGLKWIEDSQDKNAEAAYTLGMFYKVGVYYDVNIDKAFQLFEQAAKQGSILANLEIGKAYYAGAAPYQKDIEKAKIYFNVAAKTPPTNKKSESDLKNHVSYYYFITKYPKVPIDDLQKFSVLDENTQAFKDMLVLAEKMRLQQEEMAKQKAAEYEGNLDKFNSIKSQILYSTITSGIYFVLPDRPMYAGNMVALTAYHYEGSKHYTVHEHIDNLKNSTKYKVIEKYGKCNACYGRGYNTSVTTGTVADYEFTLGVKIVREVRNTQLCNQCGGCGLVPR